MAEFSWQPVMGAAQRRRQRRLRSWWRHEQQSIAAALATVMHHSSGKVHTAYGAPRSQKLATRAEEEVEYEPHYALRGQKTPPPGERPAPLSEVAGPQRSDGTVRHSAGDAPLQVVPALRGDDGVDGTTLRFLLEQNLSLKKEQEEEEKERELKEKEAQKVKLEEKLKELDGRWRAVTRELDTLLLVPFERRSDQEEDRVVKLQKLRDRISWERSALLFAPSKRKKKKKRKKKLPKSSSFLRLSRCSSRCVLSCCRLQECYVSPCRIADFRSRSSSQVVDFLLRCRGLFPWSCCSADHRVSPVAPVHVVDVPVMQVVLS